MVWYRIDESREMRPNYVAQMNEAVADLRDSLIDEGLFEESENKYMNWLKDKLQKLCPSPEKLKDFFKGIGQKIDAKIQNCKFDYIKNAWNNLKDMATVEDCQEISPEEVGLPSQGGNGEGGEAAPEETPPEENAPVEDEEQAVTAESSRYDEGFFDSLKSGWKKLTGGGEEEAPAPAKGRKTAKKGTAKKGVVKKAPAKTAATKKGTVKKGTATKKATAKKGAGKGAGKKAPAKGKGKQTAMQRVLQFLKAHWKQIVIILIGCLALYFLGSWIAASFATSSAVKGACQAVLKPAFKMPAGMKTLPKGAKLLANGVVKFADGTILASGDSAIDDDF